MPCPPVLNPRIVSFCCPPALTLQALDNLVAAAVRFVLFRHHERPGVPIKRQDINDVITVRAICEVCVTCV